MQITLGNVRGPHASLGGLKRKHRSFTEKKKLCLKSTVSISAEFPEFCPRDVLLASPTPTYI